MSSHSQGRGSALTFTGPAAPADSWVEPLHGGTNVPKQQQQQSEGRGLGDADDDVIADLESAVAEAEGGVIADPGVGGDLRPHPGGYVFIDSAYPRRPGDVARLESEQLPASGEVRLLQTTRASGQSASRVWVLVLVPQTRCSPAASASGSTCSAWTWAR